MSADQFEHVEVRDVAQILNATDLNSIHAAGWPLLNWAGWLARDGRYAEAAYTAHAGQVVVEARLIEWRDLAGTSRQVAAEMRGGER